MIDLTQIIIKFISEISTRNLWN